MDLIQSALARGNTALSEYEAKQFLKSYHIPVTREALVQSEAEAVATAREIGYPVVLKACAAALVHKSESGAVILGLKSEEDVKEAFGQITKTSSIALDGVLVQEMVVGTRELVLGLSRDSQFGPCVMFGLGGIMTEVLSDNTFRVAPFDIHEAKDMITEIRAHKILKEFRGQSPADVDTLCKCLVILGEIALKHAQVAEIDINPMIIDAKGRVTAVDALIVLQP